jgi:hypothetical protein
MWLIKETIKKRGGIPNMCQLNTLNPSIQIIIFSMSQFRTRLIHTIIKMLNNHLINQSKFLKNKCQYKKYLCNKCNSSIRYRSKRLYNKFLFKYKRGFRKFQYTMKNRYILRTKRKMTYWSNKFTNSKGLIKITILN